MEIGQYRNISAQSIARSCGTMHLSVVSITWAAL